MSFSSSASSTLVSVLGKYPTSNENAVGYTETLTLINTPTNSGESYNVVAPLTLQKGVWLLSGVLRFNAVAGGNATINSMIASINVNFALIQEITNIPTTGTNLGNLAQLPLNCIINSSDFNPNSNLSISISGTTSTGEFSIQGQGQTSVLRLVRIA
jgi:hypothetical protein